MNEKHVLVVEGQRVSREVFKSKAEADLAANKLNKETVSESKHGEPKRLVETKQVLCG